MNFLALIYGLYLSAAPAASNGFLSGPQSPQTPEPVQPPSQTSPAPAPSTSQPSPPDICQNLKTESHIKLAALLTGNERILFCSIFDDKMRDDTVAYMKLNPKVQPADAVTQIAKDAGLIFNQNPGGACGAH